MATSIDLIPDNATVGVNETVHFTLDVENASDNQSILWYVDGEIQDNNDATTFDFTTENSGGYLVTVEYDDDDANPLTDKSVVIVESETIQDIWEDIKDYLGHIKRAV